MPEGFLEILDRQGELAGGGGSAGPAAQGLKPLRGFPEGDRREFAFATVRREDGAAIGSSRFLSFRPADLGLEIGWTLVSRSAWGGGANSEAKLLMLEHAFERLGCARVEFKTDALNERARAALAALPSRFEGTFRKHMLMYGGRWRD